MGSYPANSIPDTFLRWSPEENRMQVDYCIENLRLNIMCQGDMTPVLVTKDRDKHSGWKVDFNTHHKCRNFTKLQEWAVAKGVEDFETGEEVSQ